MRLATILIGLLASAIVQSAAAQPGPTLAPTPATRLETPSRPAVSPAPAASPLVASDINAWLDGLMPYALQEGDVAGAVVAIVKDGQVLTLKGYGHSDVAKQTRVDPERTLFRPGSVSKVFTWTAVMQLVEQGKLDLDRDINAYLDFKIPPYRDRPVTLRNLMTHTPGFEEAVRGLITPELKNVGLEANLKRWIPDRVYPAGSTPAYSNYGTGLAGYIVERVSGEKFDDYIERHIFAPLDMTHSSFRQPLPPRLMAAMSKGYARASQPPQPYEYVSLAPAGSLASTARDMANFMIAHLQGGAFGSRRILRPETAATMHRTALTVLPPLNRMVLGFYEHDINGRRVISHAGDTMLFHSELNLFLDDGIGIFVSLNSLGKEAAAASIRTALFEQFADRYLPGPIRDGRVDQKVAVQHARMAAGLYQNSRRSHSNFLAVLGLLAQTEIIANADGTLTIPSQTGLAGVPKTWREIAPFVWREVGGKSLLAAQVENGRVVRFSVDDISPFMVFDRVPWWQATSWLQPLAYLGLGALVLTVLLWPVGALVRRHYRVPSPLSGSVRTASRGVRAAAIASLVAVAGWAMTISSISSNLSPSPSFDAKLIALSLLTLVAFGGGLILAGWNVERAWRKRRGWFSRLWSLVLLLAFAGLLWVAAVFRLLSFTTQF